MLDFFIFFAGGPSGRPYAYDYFISHQKLAAAADGIDEKNRFISIWEDFTINSRRLVLGSTIALFASLTIIHLTSSSLLGVACLVASFTLGCFALRRTIEASREKWLWTHQNLQMNPLSQKTAKDKKEGAGFGLSYLDFYKTLESSAKDKIFFLEEFFNKNPLNDCEEQAHSSPLSPFYKYYFELRAAYRDYQSKMGEDYRLKVENLKESLEARRSVMARKGDLAVNRSKKEKSKTMQNINDYVKRQIQIHFSELLAAADPANTFLEQMQKCIGQLSKSIEDDLTQPFPAVPDVNLEFPKSIKWPDIVYEPESCIGFSREDFEEFMLAINS